MDDEIETVAGQAHDAQSKALAVQVQAEATDSDVTRLESQLIHTSSKLTDLVKAFMDRFNGELASLSSKVATPVSAPSTRLMSNSSQPDDLDIERLAGYHHYDTNRFTTGPTLREELRSLTRNGWIKVIDFDTREEMKEWL